MIDQMLEPVLENDIELSTDYLNHYSSALMLLEMAASDITILEDLNLWRPVCYEDYFISSDLRQADLFTKGYTRLSLDQKQAFQALIIGADKLILSAIKALQPPCDNELAAFIVHVTSEALRPIIDKAALFLNSNGTEWHNLVETNLDHQNVIDQLMRSTMGAEA